MENTAVIQVPSRVIKVAIVGAECTGKTTLCQALAKAFDDVWVGEYMRVYLQHKWDTKGERCEWDDLLPIAQGQLESENMLALQADKIVFCDTNAFELMTYSYLYYGKCPPSIEWAACHHHYDLWLLTDIDVAWVADDLRDKPHERQEVFDFFEQKLIAYQKPYTIVRGTVDERVAFVQHLLEDKMTKR